MKNITLSIPDELLSKSRDYAKKHGTTLNSMVRDLLKSTVNSSPQSYESRIESIIDKVGIDTKNTKFDRDSLYER